VKRSRRTRWAEHVERTGIAYKILVAKSEGKRELGRGGRSIKVCFRETGMKGVDWIILVHDIIQWKALMDTILKLLFP
jgi:hypothetical protein